MANAAAAEAAAANEDTDSASTEDASDTGDDMADTAEPANTASVKKKVNVHLGDLKGKVLGSLDAGTTVEYFDCDDSACRLPFEGDEGFVPKSFLDLGGGDGTSAGGGFRVEIPLPGKNKVVIATVPTLANFAGIWDSKTDKNWSYVITLKQVGKKVTGGYVAQDGSKGTFNGTVDANAFNYKWTADGGYVGTGSFEMTSEGVMDGSYDTTKFPDPNMDDYYKTGTWHAERR